MDLATGLGLILGIGALLMTAMLEGTHFSALVNIPALVLIVGGSLGATVVSFAVSDLLRLPRFLWDALFASEPKFAERARQLVELAQKARREGLLALEEDAKSMDDPFLQKGLQLVVDGTEPEVVKRVLESEIAAWEEREKVGEQNGHGPRGLLPDDGDYGRCLGIDARPRTVGRPEEDGESHCRRLCGDPLRCWLCEPCLLAAGGEVENAERKTALALRTDFGRAPCDPNGGEPTPCRRETGCLLAGKRAIQIGRGTCPCRRLIRRRLEVTSHGNGKATTSGRRRTRRA